MPAYCSAYGCTNSNAKQRCIDAGISFHQYPLSDKSLLKQWLLNIRRANFVPNHSSKICSEHFEEKCFKYQNFSNRRQLKKNAVPTKFCFSRSDKNERIPSLKVDLYELDEDDGNCSDCGCVECIRKKNNVLNLRRMELPQYDIKKGLWLKSITPLKLLQKETAFIHSKYENEKEASEMKKTSNSYVQLKNLENENEVLERSRQEETEVWTPSAEEEMIDLEKELDPQTSMNKDFRKTDEISLTSDKNGDRLKYFIFPSSSNSSDTNCVSHGEALKAVETLLRYMENQEDGEKADLILIGSYKKKILEKIKKETECKS